MVSKSSNGAQYLDSRHLTGNPTEKKINSFRKLQQGWLFGEGEEFEQAVLDAAQDLNECAQGLAFYETGAFPGVDGSVIFTVYFHEHYLEFRIESAETVSFLRERDGDEVEEREGLSIRDAKTILQNFRKQLWNLSGSSIQNIIGIDDLADFRALPSDRLECHPEYRLLAGTALESMGIPSVSISGSIIGIPRATPRFSGDSRANYYPVTAE